jgi:adenosine deaminase
VSYELIQARPGHSFNDSEERFTFFEAYYGGFEVLVTEQDFYDLATNYFEHAAAMNMRYCEPFLYPQGHTRRGILWETMMADFEEHRLLRSKCMV